MEKSHLAKTMAWENLYVTLISIAAGLVIGIALDKAMQQSNAPCRKEQISTQDNKQNSKKEMKQ